MFRMVIAVLAVVGLVSLFGGAGGAVAAVGGLLLIPLLFLKFAFFALMFGFFFAAIGRGRRFSGAGMSFCGPRGRRDDVRGRQRPKTEERTQRERFEELHDLAHAKDEVDSWGRHEL